MLWRTGRKLAVNVEWNNKISRRSSKLFLRYIFLKKMGEKESTSSASLFGTYRSGLASLEELISFSTHQQKAA